jgi:acyl-CoA dehydrogenase
MKTRGCRCRSRRSIATCRAAEPVERKLVKALKADAAKQVPAEDAARQVPSGEAGKPHDFAAQLAAAEAAGAISPEERKLLERVRAATFEFISVDDFDARELEAAVIKTKPPLRSVA